MEETDIAISMDMRAEFLELEMNAVTGLSKIMIETWHASRF